MPCAIVIHGVIGSGKTTTCLRLAERARGEGIEASGIIALRVFQKGKLIGYDCQDVASGEVFPLVRLREGSNDPDWFEFGNLKYVFSVQGFERANEILTRSIQSHSPMIFIDEFGRLEGSESGLHRGVVRVAKGLKGSRVAVFACRTDMVEAVEGLIRDHVQAIIRFGPIDVDHIWHTIKKCIKNEVEKGGES